MCLSRMRTKERIMGLQAIIGRLIIISNVIIKTKTYMLNIFKYFSYGMIYTPYFLQTHYIMQTYITANFVLLHLIFLLEAET